MGLPIDTIKELGRLFWTFLKVGPSSFGGGYAMMPVIERECVEKRQWLKEEEMAEILSLASTAPGGVGVNTAAFVGYRKAGIWGAVAAIAGMTLPTFVIVIMLSLAYLTWRDEPKVAAALKGVHAAVIALILMAAYRMAKAAIFDVATTCVTVAALLLLIMTDINPFYVILLGAAVGIIVVKGKQWFGIEVSTERKGAATSPQLLEPEYFI
ncbi:chromate transporter [Paenibacillus nanensis]|uniref:chromate transporter n=1 Tax=Paenibacillus nanensis TaxID=393251 RepID=UPI001F0B8FD3|nr:chromate transporter [Paenibacillus nanensis]